ncbi:nuclear transport factor 2 family protein [Aspergillus homomorphus CBS 101889]|uniref:SnoaL-like domain-containing protein n=1 Tax=Aspergillus homomorphus (strain CBS 101889) TaxID=1450537 RepID=A0A395HXU7_ASPHC|nr:hypothetical protein BO97DRAFT_424244 [Aspergillus homomorphus CBS 101889]RAL12610.1 hypothetical protein BO97DRAFT_424244 [Aspergillus homomorphus CBS 101889]
MASTRSSYPDIPAMQAIFSNLETGNYAAFFTHVADDVNWTVTGTHPLSGAFTNKTDLQKHALGTIQKCMDRNGLALEVINLAGGGSHPWAVAELRSHGNTRSGSRFDNRYAWVFRWNGQGTIEELRAYMDSALVERTIREIEFDGE